MNHEPRKIAFIKLGSFSQINEKVRQQLEKNFPDFKVEIIDVHSLLRRDDFYLIDKINKFFILKEYGMDIFLGRKKISDLFYRTTYIFKKIKILMSHYLKDSDYIFSLQTQGLFDASRKGLPHFVYTDHTHLANLNYPSVDRKMLCTKQWIELEKTVYHNAEINFVMSKNILKSMVDQYCCHPDKVVCIYAGYNANVNKGAIDNDNYGNRNILFVGVDWERKGGPVLIEAFKSVLKVYPDARLTIVGCSPKIDVQNCEIIGRVKIDDVAQFYRKASVFCLPTNEEPFGIVLLEAMAHKLPVVATDIGAIPDFILNEENGYRVKPNNVEQLTNALVNLIGNPEKCRKFGERGCNIITERYSWGKVGNMLKRHIEPKIKHMI